MRRTVLGFLSAGSMLMLASLVFGGPWAEWSFALLAVTFPVALILLALPRRVPRGLRLGLALLALTLVLSTAGVLLLPSLGGGNRLLGLPPATLLMLFGLGLLPLAIVVWTFATSFESSDADR